MSVVSKNSMPISAKIKIISLALIGLASLITAILSLINPVSPFLVAGLLMLSSCSNGLGILLYKNSSAIQEFIRKYISSENQIMVKLDDIKSFMSDIDSVKSELKSLTTDKNIKYSSSNIPKFRGNYDKKTGSIILVQDDQDEELKEIISVRNSDYNEPVEITPKSNISESSNMSMYREYYTSDGILLYREKINSNHNV